MEPFQKSTSLWQVILRKSWSQILIFFYFHKKVLTFPCHNPKSVWKKVWPIKSYEFFKMSYFETSKTVNRTLFFFKFDFSLSIGAQTTRLVIKLEFMPKFFISSHCATVQIIQNNWRVLNSFCTWAALIILTYLKKLTLELLRHSESK